MRGGIAALCAALPLLAACAGGHDATEKELGDLRAEIVKLRADDAALAERLDTLELTSGKYRGSAATPPPPAAAVDRPNLEVVKLAPDAPDADGGDEPAVVLRSTKNGGVVEEAAGPAKKADEAAAAREYAAAIALLRSRQYDDAIYALGAFLLAHPNDPKADDAAFFRGEAYLHKSEYQHAADHFESVVRSYPEGDKVPDALFELAQAYAKLGDAAAADKAKQRLLATYPASDAAKKLGRAAPAKAPKL